MAVGATPRRANQPARLAVFGDLARPEAAVAAAPQRRTEVAAAGLGHRAEARHAMGDHDADGAIALALDAFAVARDVRPAAVEIARSVPRRADAC